MKKKIFIFALLPILFVSAFSSVFNFSNERKTVATNGIGDPITITSPTTLHSYEVSSPLILDFNGTLNLPDSNNYTIRANKTISAIKIKEGRTVTIVTNGTLYLYGGDADGTIGAGAGIEVPETSTLIIAGKGNVRAYGGNAEKGQNGSDSIAPKEYSGEKIAPGRGGAGGNGGGGAGAGIGGRGGNGGFGGAATDEHIYETNATEHAGYSGNAGKNGLPGGVCGKVYSNNNSLYYIEGGKASNESATGGNKYSQEKVGHLFTTYYYGGWSGGGGGAGGNGYPAAKVGDGGAGGGGGASGGEGVLDYWYWEGDFNNCHGAGKGGIGGYGYVNGGTGTDYGENSNTTNNIKGGSSGAAGQSGGTSGASKDIYKAYLFDEIELEYLDNPNDFSGKYYLLNKSKVTPKFNLRHKPSATTLSDNVFTYSYENNADATDTARIYITSRSVSTNNASIINNDLSIVNHQIPINGTFGIRKEIIYQIDEKDLYKKFDNDQFVPKVKFFDYEGEEVFPNESKIKFKYYDEFDKELDNPPAFPGNYYFTLSVCDDIYSVSKATANTKYNFVIEAQKITFDKNGGNGGTDLISILCGQHMPKITLPSKEGFTFLGYFDQLNGGKQYYGADGSSLNYWDKLGDNILYAQWQFIGVATAMKIAYNYVNTPNNSNIFRIMCAVDATKLSSFASTYGYEEYGILIEKNGSYAAQFCFVSGKADIKGQTVEGVSIYSEGNYKYILIDLGDLIFNKEDASNVYTIHSFLMKDRSGVISTKVSSHSFASLLNTYLDPTGEYYKTLTEAQIESLQRCKLDIGL